MATYTSNYRMIKPDPGDPIEIQDLNDNFDKIDLELHEKAATGPQGPQGPIGPEGPAGPAGSDANVAKYLAIPGEGGEMGEDPMQTVILYNPGPSEKRVCVEAAGGRGTVTIPPLSSSIVLTQNGAFSLVNHGGIETKCSPSITHNRTDANVAHYEVDTCGIVYLQYEFSM